MSDLLTIQAAISAGDEPLAETLVEAALAVDGRNARLLALRGEINHAQRRFDRAVADFRQALAIEPDNAVSLNALGKSLNNLRRHLQAAQAFEQALALDPGFAEAWHNLGHVRRARRDHAGALDAFKKAVAIDPAFAAAWHNAGIACLALDDPAGALGYFDRAAELASARPRLPVHRGVALHQLGRHAEAIAAYRESLARQPDDAEALNNLAISLQETGAFDEALAAYEKASLLAPGDHQIRIKTADLLIGIGRPADALKIARQCLDQRPGQAGALAVAAVASLEPGGSEVFPGLLDFASLIANRHVEVPAGFASIGDFNEALVSHVVNHPSLVYEPAGHATRKGSHTGDLLVGDQGPVAPLEIALSDQIQSYVAGLEPARFGFLLDGQPRQWGLTMWAVVMDDEGHQLPHIHPAAWLSGVYYAKVPATIRAGDPDRCGWIEFGRPPESLNCKGVHPTVSLCPSAGDFFLFPSYFYHRTIPFHDHQRRICLAFDVIPV